MLGKVNTMLALNSGTQRPQEKNLVIGQLGNCGIEIKGEIFRQTAGFLGVTGQTSVKKPGRARGKHTAWRERDRMSVDFNIAGAGMDIQQYTPAADLTLHVVMRYRSLNRDGMVGAETSRRGARIQIESSSRRNLQPDGSGASAHTPIAFGFTFSPDISTARSNLQAALDAI